ncbi:MAG: LacI family DNA-binding transcriptional regulator [Bacteroidota bacterium]
MVRKGFQIKLSDIAKKLNVTTVTVSKALRGHPDISGETIKKVKAVAKELGYVPNFMARNLSSRHSKTLGVIVPKIAHFFFSMVIESIYDAAFENGYEIILTVSQENPEREIEHIQTLLAMRVDGLIISVTENTIDYTIFDTIRKSGLPITFIDRIIPLKEFNTIVTDDYNGAVLATQQAIQCGYKKLGMIGGFQHTNIGRDRLKGFKDTLKKHHLSIYPEKIVLGGFGEQEGYKGFMKLYSSGNLPEFILAVSFPVALGIYRAAYELGLKIPKDFDIICFGSGTFNQLLTPRLTMVDQPASAIGRAAVELTLENIRNTEYFETKHLKLPTKLVMGDTCVKRNEKSRR